MAVAANVKHYLDSHRVTYRMFMHERTRSLQEASAKLGLHQRDVIQAILLKDAGGIVLALLPLDHQIDLAKLSKQTHRIYQIIPPNEADRYFNDCEPGSHPPLGMAYGLPIILDKSLENLNPVYFEGGCHTFMIQMSREDFHFLTGDAPSYSFAVLNHTEENSVPENSWAFNKEVVVNFPTLPLIARQILDIAEEHPSEASVIALTNLIAHDPKVNDHILYCAHMAAKRDNNPPLSDSLSDVITKVLGFKTVSHIAVGVTAGRAFHVPNEGPLGLNNFWRHALQCALLAKKIAEQIPKEKEIDPNVGYLTGFFHNFGYLLLGHWFPHEFRLLNRWILLNPKVPVESLEKRLLGMGQAMTVLGKGHARLGAWLMKYWGMPDSIVTVTRFHHSKNYDGVYASYIHLIQLTNQLLKATGLGDGEIGKVDLKKLASLGLTLQAVEVALAKMQTEMQGLNRMASELAT